MWLIEFDFRGLLFFLYHFNLTIMLLVKYIPLGFLFYRIPCIEGIAFRLIQGFEIISLNNNIYINLIINYIVFRYYLPLWHIIFRFLLVIKVCPLSSFSKGGNYYSYVLLLLSIGFLWNFIYFYFIIFNS